jgi:hypothetical protein
LPGLLSWLLRAARAIGQLNRPKKREPNPYQAFVIGPDGYAISMHVIAADGDTEAVGAVMQLQGDLRIGLWCGSRKVGDVPAIA